MSGPVFFSIAIAVVLLVALGMTIGSVMVRRSRIDSIRRQQYMANSAIDRLTMQALRSMLEEARRSSGHKPWDN